MFHLFRKDIEKHCAYCRGIVDSADHCRHFCYDPLKRVPPRPAALNDKYTSEDFSL